MPPVLGDQEAPYYDFELDRVELPWHQHPQISPKMLPRAVSGSVRTTSGDTAAAREGPRLGRVTLPWHQHPHNVRDTHPSRSGEDTQQSPRNSLTFCSYYIRTISSLNDDVLSISPSDTVAPFFLASYHSRNTTPAAMESLRLHEVRRCIATLRILGYAFEYGDDNTPLAEDVASMSFFHHFTDPNDRMMGLIGTMHAVTTNLKGCLREQTDDARVEDWKRRVFQQGFEVYRALGALVARFH